MREPNVRMEDVQVAARNIKIRPRKREMLVQELNKLSESRKRVKAPDRPEGGITLREAERLYNVPNETIRRWARAGKVKILLETKNCVYVDNASVAAIVNIYRAAPGRGKRTVYKG